MNTTSTQSPKSPQSLLSPAVRAFGLVCAVAIIAATMTIAGRASEQAVHSAQAAISPAVRYITLQPVEVVFRRSAQPLADASCASGQSRT